MLTSNFLLCILAFEVICFTPITKTYPIESENESCSETDEFCLSRNKEALFDLTWNQMAPSRKALCTFCDITFPILRELIDKNKTEYFHDIATTVCIKLKLADNTVCDMAIKSYEVFFTLIYISLYFDFLYSLILFKVFCFECGERYNTLRERIVFNSFRMLVDKHFSIDMGC